MQKYRGELLTPGWAAGGASVKDAPSPWRTRSARLALQQDSFIGATLALAALALYAATLLPGLGSRDTAEFQWVVPTLGLAHPTGYPLYTMLGWLWSRLPIGGTPAWRMNMFSAATAALAIGAVYHVARAIGQRPAIAAAVAGSLAVSLTFWSQATIAEVYGLAALLQALLILALLRWRANVWPLWIVGLLAGLGLAHHRSTVLMAPGVLLFVMLGSFPAPASGARNAQPRAARLKDVGLAALALLAGCLLYLYVPMRAPAWMRTWQQVWEHISGAVLTATWFDPARLRAEGLARVGDLARRFVWPQFFPIGVLVALLGSVHLLRRDRALAGLVLVGYLAIAVFCAAYYVADVEVFFLPAHLLAALLLGEGAMFFSATTGDHQPPTTDRRGTLSFVIRRRAIVGPALIILPALLLIRNLGAVQALNTSDAETAAREIMAQPLAPGALVIGDWFSTEGLRYLQVIEGRRRDVQLGVGVGRDAIDRALAHGRAVYLVEPDLGLGLAQWPEGQLWRIGAAPIQAASVADIRWEEGVALAGYTLPSRPSRPGDKVPVLLQWQALAAPRHGYTLFIHFIGADGTIWGQRDSTPAQAPTDQWRLGGRYTDLVALALKPGAPAGRYQVNIGWYAYPSMRRLGLASGEGAGADYVTIGAIDVAPAR